MTEEQVENKEAVEPEASEEKPAQEEPLNSDNVVGKIVDGEVTNVTNFGAFVKIPEIGEEGLVHISEVANEYITDITKHIAVGDKVRVKVMVRNDKGKLELSIKRTKEKPAKPSLFLNQKSKDNGFEEKLTQFLKRSEEKQIDIRRNIKTKQGISKKRK